MTQQYPNFGEAQPKNLCRTTNRNFGSQRAMRAVDSKAFGRRVATRREELGLSQQQLGEKAGYSQSNIGWLENGNAKRPQRAAGDLATPLQTTRDWLLWGEGQKQVGPVYLPAPVLIEKYEALPPEQRAAISQAIEKYEKSQITKRAS